MAKIKYRTDERDHLHRLQKEFECSPFTGRCYTDEVSLQKIGKTYHIILSEQQMEKFNLEEDYVLEERGSYDNIHKMMLMIKPTAMDNNYIFFRRV